MYRDFQIPIIQHMPPTATCSNPVVYASRREEFNRHRIFLDPEPVDPLFVPSVDVMMESVSVAFPVTILGVIMTGMGNDGLNGFAPDSLNWGPRCITRFIHWAISLICFLC